MICLQCRLNEAHGAGVTCLICQTIEIGHERLRRGVHPNTLMPITSLTSEMKKKIDDILKNEEAIWNRL